jgi:hypothetical protein
MYNTLMVIQWLIMITGMIIWLPATIMMNQQTGILILIASLTALNGLRQEAHALTKEK